MSSRDYMIYVPLFKTSKLHVHCQETILSFTIQMYMYVSKSLERVEQALPWKKEELQKEKM